MSNIDANIACAPSSAGGSVRRIDGVGFRGPSLLAIVIPVKSIGEQELTRLNALGTSVPQVRIVAVGELSAVARPVPNLRVLDVACSLYAAMNVGSEHADARYLLFMGADDVLLAENIPGTLAQLEEMRQSLVVLPFRVGEREVKQRPARKPRSFHHQGVLFERETLLASGGYSDRYRLHSDLDLMLRIQRHGSIAALDRPLVSFSKGGMSTSGRHAMTSIREFFAIYGEHRASRLSGSFAFSIALLLWYRVRFVVGSVFNAAR